MAISTSFATFKVVLSTYLFLIFVSFSLKKGHALDRGLTAESNYHSVHISSLIAPSACIPSPKGPSRTASLKVVHKNNPCNPPNQQESNKATLTEVLSQDQSRVKSIQNRYAFSSNRKTLLNSEANLPAKLGGLTLGTGSFIVTVGLGSPKKDFTVIFDTGSDLTWTQCQPCVGSCYNQQDPIYDPRISSSYSNISCSSAQCFQLSSATGNIPGCSSSTCIYDATYADDSFSIGFFGKDKLTLTPTDVFDGFLFGCGQNNTGSFGNHAGLIGLGRDPLSIVSQTAQKYGKFFSYCLPSSSGTGHLTFGKGAVPSNVKFTDFSSSKSDIFYFVDVEGISVGGRHLSIDTSVFQTAGTVVDSGTLISRLPPAAYSALRDAFRQEMTQYNLTQPLSILDTCYDLSNVTTIPKISFFFSGNIKIDLGISGMLVAASKTQVCLAFAGNSDATDVGVFGSIQQQTLEVVYDVAGGKIGFGDCGCA